MILSGEVAVIAFVIPESLEPGLHAVQISTAERRTEPTEIAVASPETIETRTALAERARDQASELFGRSMDIVAPFEPLPAGTLLSDAIDQEADTYEIVSDQAWLFFVFQRGAGFAQETAWLLFDGDSGELETSLLRSSWPEGVGVAMGPSVFHGGVFAVVRESPLKAWNFDPQPGPATAERPKGITGRLTGTTTGKCPNGYTTIPVIVQLSDEPEKDPNRPDFDELADSISDLFTSTLDVPSGNVQTLKPGDFWEQTSTGDWHFDLSEFADLMRDLFNAEGLDCECTEFVVIVISHGLEVEGTQDLHPVTAQYIEADGTKHRDQTSTKDLTTTIAILQENAGATACPVTFVDHTCYSGQSLDQGPYDDEGLGQFPGHNIELITSSDDGETSNGDTDDTGEQNVHFFDALKECLEEHGSFAEAWECIQKKTNRKSKAGLTGDPQHPQRRPPAR